MKWPLMRETITLKDRWEMIRFIINADRFTNGPQVKDFESQWSKWLAPNHEVHSLFVSSGSTANFLLVAAVMELYDIKPGSKVLLPACTWMTNVAPPMQLGLVPVFCDVSLQNFSFDLEHASRIARSDPDIALIFVSHLLGFPGPNQELQELFPDAVIIDDICESHGCLDIDGTKKGGKSIGSTFSFYYGHHITSVEGGVVSTTNYDLYDLMRMKRSHGMARESTKFKDYREKYPDIDPSFIFVTDGYNFRNHEICAVLAKSQLERLDEFIHIRRSNYTRYVQILNKHLDLFQDHKYEPGNSSFCFPFICNNDNTYQKLKTAFKDNGIEYRPIVAGNLLEQPFLNGYKKYNVPNADRIHKLGVYIGNNHFVSNKELDLLENILENLNQ